MMNILMIFSMIGIDSISLVYIDIEIEKRSNQKYDNITNFAINLA
jgi:hypothetical protein